MDPFRACSLEVNVTTNTKTHAVMKGWEDGKGDEEILFSALQSTQSH